MGYGVVCQVCGIEAPTKKVEFNQNIGAVVMRFRRSVKGYLCKSCVHSTFWRMTCVTLAIGWLGMISVIIAPIFIISNLVHYLAALGMPPVPPGACKPVITDGVAQRVNPQLNLIVQRLNQGQDLADIARDMAKGLQVTPGELAVYTVAALRTQRSGPPPVPQAQGFPVIPVAPQPQQAVPQPPQAAPLPPSPPVETPGENRGIEL